MQNNEIGLIVWGCKGGHRVFCSHGVDYRDKPINDTIKDIRAFVRFNLINLTTYAIEFTDKYKVFTIYRSCNDSGTGAYVAITMYIPHNLKVYELRKTLDTMMNFYFKEFIHPVFGTYYDGKYDSIEQYYSFLEGLDTVRESQRFEYVSSKQDDRPHLFLYDNIEEVDTFFDSPYRKEFYRCQEVMFMSQDIYKKRPESLRFNFTEEIIQNVSEPTQLPQFNIGDNKEVIQLTINNQECNINECHPVNIATDNVNIIMRRQYCNELTISGKIDQLIHEGTLRLKEKSISIGEVKFEYKNYDISFTLNGHSLPNGLAYIQAGTKAYPITNSKINISGRSLTTKWTLYIQPCLLSNNLNLLPISSFIPSENLDSPVDITIEKQTLTVIVKRGVSDSIFYVYIDKYNKTLEIPIKSGSESQIDFYLPKDVQLSNNCFDIKNAETELLYKDNVLTINPKELTFEVYLPEEIKRQIKDWDFVISQESRKKGVFFADSLKIKIRPEEDIRSGKLYFNNVEFGYKEHDGTIFPNVLYVKLINDNTNKLFTYNLCPLKEEINTIENAIYPYENIALADIEVDTNSYIKELTEKQGIITVTLKRKVNTPKQLVFTENVWVSFVNCKDIFFKSDKPVANDKNYKLTSEYLEILNNEKDVVCVLYKDSNNYTEEHKHFNLTKGFNILYDDTGEKIQVKYSKPKRGLLCKLKNSTLFCKLKKKSLYFIILFLLLVISGFGLWWWWLKPDSSISLMRVYVNVANPYKFDETIDGLEVKDTELLVTGKDDKGCYIDVMWNKDSLEQNKYENVLRREIHAKIKDDNVPFYLEKKDVSSILNYAKGLDNDIESIKTEPKISYISICSPIQKKVASINNEIEQRDSLGTLFKDIERLVKAPKYKKIEESVLILCSRKLLQTKNLADCNSFLDLFMDYNQLKDYIAVGNLRDSIENAYDEESKRQEHIKMLIKECSYNKGKLHELSCNLNTVAQVKEWFDNLNLNDQKYINNNLFNFRRAFDAYNIFFKATNCGEIQKLDDYKSCFSEKQFGVIKFKKGYREKNETFNDWKKEMGMSFEKPYSNNYIKN